MSLPTYRKIGDDLRTWGRWGPWDQLGTVNLITDQVRTAAVAAARTGTLFDLAMPLDDNGPQDGHGRFNPIHRMTRIPGDGALRDGMLLTDDIVIMPLQCATQWDGLTHVGYDGLLYNGVPATAVTASFGATRNGFDHVAPRLVGRGVLLDIAAFKGVDALAAGEPVSARDLTDAAARQGVEVRSGDILVVRTGWYRHFLAGDRRTYMGRSAPGLDMSCCAWLAEHEVAAVACDNYLVEVQPAEPDAGARHPFHMVMIRDVGMTLGEMFNLEPLAAHCAAHRVWEFLLCATGLKVTGSAGSPVTPVAIL